MSGRAKKKSAAKDGAGAPTMAGHCPAMGRKYCNHNSLSCGRHKCDSCTEYVHAIAPCGFEFQKDGEDILLCGLCKDKHIGKYMTHGEGSDAAVLKRKRLVEKVVRDASSSEDDDDDQAERQRQYNSRITLKPYKTSQADLDYVHDPTVPRVHERLGKRLGMVVPPIESDGDTVATAAEGTDMPPLKGQAQKKKRGPNFCAEENLLVAQTWVSTSEDPRKGTGQKGFEFEASHAEAYNTAKDAVNRERLVLWNRKKGTKGKKPVEFVDRDAQGIKNKWCTIKHAASKWAGVCKRVKQPSGDTDGSKVLAKRHEVYAETIGEGKPFPFIQCFEILELTPKWLALNETGDMSGGTKKAKGKKAPPAPNKGRPVGKRTKALTDKVAQVYKDKTGADFAGSGNSGAGEAMKMLSSQLSGMTQMMSMQYLPEDARKELMESKAAEHKLESKKRQLQLQKEIDLLEGRDGGPTKKAKKLPNNVSILDSSSSDESDDTIVGSKKTGRD